MIFALVLISLGSLLLLANFNLVSWSVFYELWQFWPVILIIWGLQLIFGKSRPGRVLVAVFSILLTIYLLIGITLSTSSIFRDWLGFDSTSIFPMARHMNVSTERQTQSLDFQNEATSRTATFKIGAARFSLTDSASQPEALLIDEPSDSSLEVFSQVLTKTNVLTVESPDSPWFIFHPSNSDYQVSLGQVDLPTDLNIELGASRVSVLLDDSTLTNLNIELAASTADFTIGEKSLPDSLNIDVGAGSATLRLPANTPLKLDYSIGAGSLVIDNDRFGNGSGSSNVEGTGRLIKLTVNIGAGSVTVIRQ